MGVLRVLVQLLKLALDLRGQLRHLFGQLGDLGISLGQLGVTLGELGGILRQGGVQTAELGAGVFRRTRRSLPAATPSFDYI